MGWIKFDIKSFMKASRGWKEEIKRLREERDALLTLPSVENSSGVHSSEPSNITATTALKRLEIEAEINELLLNEEMLRFAMKRLTEDERTLIKGFYFPKKKKGLFVEEYGKKHGLCQDYVYRDKDLALEKMRVIIENEFYE